MKVSCENRPPCLTSLFFYGGLPGALHEEPGVISDCLLNLREASKRMIPWETDLETKDSILF